MQQEIFRRHLGGGARSEIVSRAMQTFLDSGIDTDHPSFFALAEMVQSLGGREPTSMQDAVARLSRQFAALPQEDAHVADIEAHLQHIATPLEPLQAELQEAYNLGLDNDAIDLIFDVLQTVRPDIPWRERLHDVNTLCQALSEQIGHMARDSDEFRFTLDRLRALLTRLRRRESDAADRARMQLAHARLQSAQAEAQAQANTQLAQHRDFLATPHARSFAERGRSVVRTDRRESHSRGREFASGVEQMTRTQRI